MLSTESYTKYCSSKLLKVVSFLTVSLCLPGKRKLSNQSTTRASETSAMLPEQSPQTPETENKLNDIIYSLREELAQLRSQTEDKEKTIHQLQEQSSSRPCGVMCQLKQPTIPPNPFMSSPESLTTPNPTPDFSSDRRKLLPKAVKASKKNSPKPDKPSKKNSPKPNKATKNDHPAPSRPLQTKRRNSSPAHLTSAPPELPSPVCDEKVPVVHIRSQSDPVHQVDPNPVYSWKSISGPSSFSSYNRFSPLAEDWHRSRPRSWFSPAAPPGSVETHSAHQNFAADFMTQSSPKIWSGE